MFETLTSRLTSVFDSLTRRGALTEANVDEALRAVRLALLEADVALDVVRSFTDKVRHRAVGTNIIKSVTPGQMVVKIVHDVLVETLGSEASPLALNATPPVGIMMVGLQGAGKTTTSAKLALRLMTQMKKRVLMASLDVKRPAAQEQLAILGRQHDIPTLSIMAGQTPVAIARRAAETARLQGFDAIILDTAGRTHLDDDLMEEMAHIKAVTQPHEILLVADSLTGQDAVRIAKTFHERVTLTGLILTRMDGDGRGGACLSMRAVTGQPIKFLGVSEKIDGLEEFHPRRIADRILDRGDIVALVEKAAASIDAQKAEAMAARMRKGKFDLADYAEQLAQIEQIGGLSGLMGFLPGVAKFKDKIAEANLDNRVVKRQRAIILSMTPNERAEPDILKASRKRRIAAGSGTKVEDVNRLLKLHRQMADTMKAMAQGKGGMMGKMAQMLGMPSGMGMPGVMQAGMMPTLPPGGLPAQNPFAKDTMPKGLAAHGLPDKMPDLGGSANPFGAIGLPGSGMGKIAPNSKPVSKDVKTKP